LEAGSVVATPDINRKVRQLDNDVQAIYGLLEGITENQHKHSTALADLGVAVTGIRATQQRQYNRLDELDGRFEGLESGLAEVRTTLSRHGNRFEEFDGRFDRLETKVDGLETKVDGLESRFDGLESKVDGLETKVDGLDAKLDLVLGRLDQKTPAVGA
jgi:chromosome segregation ATPase